MGGETGGYKALTRKYNVKSKSQVENWVNRYEQFGEEGLKRSMTKKSYSGEFKLSVLQYRQLNKCSYRETANHFGIANSSTIANWQRKYLAEGFEGLNKTSGRPGGMPKKSNERDWLKLTLSEKEELIRLREENEFLKASLAYEKKLKALVQAREQKTKKKQK